MSLNTTPHVGRRNLSAQTATGSSQTTAFLLPNECDVEFTTVAASTGAMLPIGKLASAVKVWNGGLNTLSVYPPVGGKVNAGSLNAAYSLAAGSGVEFFAADILTWYPDSASASGSGTVTNVTFTGDGTILSATPSAAVTTTGTLTATLANQSANVVLAGPASGSAAPPTVRALVTADLPSGVPVRLYEQVANVTVSDASGTTTLTSNAGALGSLTLPAGAMNLAGRAIEVEASGYMSTASTTANVNFNVSLGGAIVSTNVATSISASKTNVPWHARIRLVCKSTGATGTVDSGGVFTDLGATTVLSQGLLNFANGTTAGVQAPTVAPVVNWTAGLLLDFSVTYNTAIVGHITVLNSLSFKLIP